MGTKKREAPTSKRFATLERLIRQVAPSAVAVEKWGTRQFEVDGKGFFGLAERDAVLKCYVFIPGLLAEHASGLGHIKQTSCCLRFGADDALPLPALKAVMRDAIERESKS